VLTCTVHITVVTTPCSNEPLLLDFRSCLYIVGCEHKHLWQYRVQRYLIRQKLTTCDVSHDRVYSAQMAPGVEKCSSRHL